MVVWKVRADCTYTTTNNKNTRQAAIEAIVAAYPQGWNSNVTGRFPGGVTSQSSTRFTVAVDFAAADVEAAKGFASEMRDALSASARNQTYFSIHDAGGE